MLSRATRISALERASPPKSGLQDWPLGLTITGSPGDATAFVGGSLYVRIDSGDAMPGVRGRGYMSVDAMSRQGALIRLRSRWVGVLSTTPLSQSRSARA
jgi:hypothetical protein